MSNRPPIYLDYNATTPVAPEVTEAMLPYLRDTFGNPSSSHWYGRIARDAVAQAREYVAALVGACADEIVFAGCATEANNLAVLGAARAHSARGRHMLTTAVEHPAVLQPALRLRQEGWEVTVLPVDAHGRVSVEALAQALRRDTVLVSVMHANNEVGTIQPVADIAALTRPRGILLHCDAAQSAAKIPVDVATLGVDLLALAGHKFYAPKGVGALYVRKGVTLAPPLAGADQEQGLRAGTENVPAIVGLGEAARLGRERLEQTQAHLTGLRDRLHGLLIAAVPGLLLNGHPEYRLPSTLSVSFPGVSGRALLESVDATVAASLGSACHSEHDAVSGVLAAMGFDAARAMGAVRLSVGTPTDEAQVASAAAALAGAWRGLYRSPARRDAARDLPR